MSRLVLASLTGRLEGRVGHGNEKVGEKRRFRDACDAGGEGTGQGLRGEGGGTGSEKFENKRKKEAKHKQGSFQGKGKEEAVEKRKRSLRGRQREPRAAALKKEWAEVAQAAKLRRKSAQSARTSVKKANVGNARAQARASIAES
jgi:hypothetical protein